MTAKAMIARNRLEGEGPVKRVTGESNRSHNARPRQSSRNAATLAALAPLAIAGVSGQLPAQTDADPDERPNIVFVLSDDQGWSDVGFNGGEFYETPYLDRMAREGMIFTDAYSGGPNCAPTRASLISGMYPPRHMIYTPFRKSSIDPRQMRLWVPVRGIFWSRAGLNPPERDPFEVRRELNPSVVSFAEVLKQGGYTTARLGKWQVGPDTQGFDVSSSDGKPGTESEHYKDPDATFDLTDAGVEFIRENRDRPFFLYLAHWDPHLPLVARDELVAKYKEKLASWTKNENTYDPTYAAMVEAVDTSVGRILETLDELNLSEKTLIIFSSDNGGDERVSINRPLRGFKRSLYEGSVRVPTCMRWPGVIEAGSKSTTPITSVDFLPTFAELAGVDLPTTQPVDGESFVALLKGELAPRDRAIFWHFPLYSNRRGLATPASAIRKGDWKLIEYFEDGRLELYNLAADISESRNLADAEPAMARELHEELRAWREETNAPEPRPANPFYTGPLTALFEAVPSRHTGSSPFNLRVRFSEAVVTSEEALRTTAIGLTGGQITQARRIEGLDWLWELTVVPSGAASVLLTLPATASCSATGAVCTAGGKPLSNSLALTIPGHRRWSRFLGRRTR